MGMGDCKNREEYSYAPTHIAGNARPLRRAGLDGLAHLLELGVPPRGQHCVEVVAAGVSSTGVSHLLCGLRRLRAGAGAGQRRGLVPPHSAQQRPPPRNAVVAAPLLCRLVNIGQRESERNIVGVGVGGDGGGAVGEVIRETMR